MTILGKFFAFLGLVVFPIVATGAIVCLAFWLHNLRKLVNVQAERIDGIMTGKVTLPGGDHPLIRPLDRWGQMDEVWRDFRAAGGVDRDKLRIEVENIETQHRRTRDGDSHEPGS